MKTILKIVDAFFGGVQVPLYLIISFFLLIIILIIFTAAMWKIFQKAGQRGWAIIIPFYRDIILLRIADKPKWWIIFFILHTGLNFIGADNLIKTMGYNSSLIFIAVVYGALFAFYIFVLHSIIKKFGKNITWTFGCAFLPFIFLPIIAWDKKIKFHGDGSIVHQEQDPKILDSFGN